MKRIIILLCLIIGLNNALQSQEIVFRESDGAIVITNADGQVHTIIFNDDGTITETFSGEKTITKTTKFEGNSIVEVIS